MAPIKCLSPLFRDDSVGESLAPWYYGHDMDDKQGQDAAVAPPGVDPLQIPIWGLRKIAERLGLGPRAMDYRVPRAKSPGGAELVEAVMRQDPTTGKWFTTQALINAWLEKHGAR